MADISNINKIFGQRLKHLRETNNLFQEDVGEWFKMRKSTVSQWESGRLPHATIITELAERFNCTTDYLLGKESYPLRKGQIISEEHPDQEVAQLLKDNGVEKLKLAKDVTLDELERAIKVIKALREENKTQ